MKLALVLTTTVAALSAAELGNNPVTVHEWGTFTSVAGLDGKPITWAPLNGKPDLPCFVSTIDRQNAKYWPGTIRMETPVLYFYAQRPTTLNVRVDFPRGWITEWYPKESSQLRGEQRTGDSSMQWDNVEVLPGADLAFPQGESPTHYYTARETDAAPLRVNGQQEKMIFYRGIGHFEPALWPRYTGDDHVEIRNTGELPIHAAIVFENRDGRVGYRIVRDLKDPVTVRTPELNGNTAEVRDHMRRQLQDMGMFEKEAIAMIETWRDSWFEEGTRVFYFVPPADVDKHLPLTVSPAPSSIARAFVGRVEMLSPATRQRIKGALATNDRAAVERMGRFLQPFAQMMGLRLPQWAAWQSAGPACVE